VQQRALAGPGTPEYRKPFTAPHPQFDTPKYR
jgi:hypothetical protein